MDFVIACETLLQCLQATIALAVGEEACLFEHRDLHWGNILLRRTGTPSVAARLRGAPISAAAAGMEVTLIDFTLSRLDSEGGATAFCDLEQDPALFLGPKGDCQVSLLEQAKTTIHT